MIHSTGIRSNCPGETVSPKMMMIYPYVYGMGINVAVENATLDDQVIRAFETERLYGKHITGQDVHSNSKQSDSLTKKRPRAGVEILHSNSFLPGHKQNEFETVIPSEVAEFKNAEHFGQNKKPKKTQMGKSSKGKGPLLTRKVSDDTEFVSPNLHFDLLSNIPISPLSFVGDTSFAEDAIVEDLIRDSWIFEQTSINDFFTGCSVYCSRGRKCVTRNEATSLLVCTLLSKDDEHSNASLEKRVEAIEEELYDHWKQSSSEQTPEKCVKNSETYKDLIRKCAEVLSEENAAEYVLSGDISVNMLLESASQPQSSDSWDSVVESCSTTLESAINHEGIESSQLAC